MKKVHSFLTNGEIGKKTTQFLLAIIVSRFEYITQFLPESASAHAIIVMQLTVTDLGY
jgi:undecaprenyl pyrophosphate phosphatase UppP